MSLTQHPIYEALMIPNDALDNGGLEILRAGIVKDELYVTARRVFKDASRWGDVLADIARHIALLYSAEDTDLTEKEILAEIVEAFAADLGARAIKDRAKKRKIAKRKAPTRRRKAKASTRKTTRRKKR